MSVSLQVLCAHCSGLSNAAMILRVGDFVQNLQRRS